MENSVLKFDNRATFFWFYSWIHLVVKSNHTMPDTMLDTVFMVTNPYVLLSSKKGNINGRAVQQGPWWGCPRTWWAPRGGTSVHTGGCVQAFGWDSMWGCEVASSNQILQGEEIERTIKGRGISEFINQHGCHWYEGCVGVRRREARCEWPTGFVEQCAKTRSLMT